MEKFFASQRAPIPGSFWARDGVSIRHYHPLDIEKHQSVHKGTSRCQQTAPSGRLPELAEENQLTLPYIAGRRGKWT